MGYRLEIEIAGLPKMTNPSGARSTHWRVRKQNTDLWKNAVRLTVGARKPPAPLKRAHLELIRYSSVPPDADGLVSGFKPLIDGLVECGVLENDRWENIGMPHYMWRPAAPKQGKVQIYVTEVEGDAHVGV